MAVGPMCLADTSPAAQLSELHSSYSAFPKSFATSGPLQCPFLRALSANCPFLKSSPQILHSPPIIETSRSKAKPHIPSEHPQIHRNEPPSSSSVHGSYSGAAGLIDIQNSELLTELSINGISLDDEMGSTHHAFPEADVAALPLAEASAIQSRYTNRRSSIMGIGISVHTAPVKLREKLSIPEADWASAIKELCDFPHIEEACILSTCNRMEVYVVALSWQRGIVEVLQWMSKTSGIPEDELREHLVVVQNKDATQHLFKVASGLDSLVLGEGQILAQVKHVLQVSQAEEGFGRILTGLFKQAISAGKRVRSETSIGTGAVSVSSAAVELIASKLAHGSRFPAARVLIVGAGKMAKLLVQCLISKGCTRIVMVNRSEQKVQELQLLFPDAVLVYHPLHELMRCVGEADVVFTCTASDAPLLFKSAVRDLHSAGMVVSGVRHFVDISVPRNVSECVAELESAALYNVDHLEEVVAANKEKRGLKALEAQAIIEEETKSFENWRDSLETVPTIKKLRAYAEKIRQGEVEKCFGKMKDNLTPQNKKLVEDLSRAIVNKLLHGPMSHLRYDGKGEQTIDEILENKRALERIFELQQDADGKEQQMKQVAK